MFLEGIGGFFIFNHLAVGVDQPFQEFTVFFVNFLASEFLKTLVFVDDAPRFVEYNRIRSQLPT